MALLLLILLVLVLLVLRLLVLVLLVRRLLLLLMVLLLGRLVILALSLSLSLVGRVLSTAVLPAVLRVRRVLRATAAAVLLLLLRRRVVLLLGRRIAPLGRGRGVVIPLLGRRSLLVASLLLRGTRVNNRKS